MSALDPCRPYFVPEGADFDPLPEGLKLAIREIVGPAYRELVLGASDALERAAGATFVHLLWLELVEQRGLGTQIARHLPKGGTMTELVFEDDFNAHLRLLGAKHKAAAFLLRLHEFRAKQHVSVAPWLRNLSDSDCPRTCYMKLLPYTLHPAGAKISEVFLRVARMLAEAEVHLRISCFDLHVWWPTNTELEGLAYCRDLQSAEALREFLLSEDRTGRAIRQFRDPASLSTTPDPLADYVEARGKLLKTRADLRSGDCSDWNLRLAQENFNRLLEQVFAAPLLGEASASEDPIRRTQLVALADLVRWLHHKLLEANEHLGGNPPSEAAGKGRQAAAGREGKELVAMLERIEKLAEKIRGTSS